MSIPSSTACGSPSSTARSMNAPGSPSSALQITYFLPVAASRRGRRSTSCPVEKPAPPRPRRPGGLHLLDHLLRGHGGEDLPQRRRSRPRARYSLDGLRVDDAAVGQHDPASAGRGRGSPRGSAAPRRGCPPARWASTICWAFASSTFPYRKASVRLPAHLHQGLARGRRRCSPWRPPAMAGRARRRSASRASKHHAGPRRRCRRSSSRPPAPDRAHALPFSSKTDSSSLSPVSRP